MRISFREVTTYPWPCANPECSAILEAGPRTPLEIFDCQMAFGFGHAAALLCDDCAARIRTEALEFEDLPIQRKESDG